MLQCQCFQFLICHLGSKLICWAVEEAKNDTINVCPGISFLYSLVNKKVYKLKVKFCASILVGLWSKSPSCSFIEQLLLLHSCEWLLLSIYLINKCDKKIRHMKNQIMTHHITFWRKI